MPTGYTGDIYEGKDVTAKEYILKCARAFGALITMRDDPMDAEIPDEFKPSNYNQECIEEAKVKLNKYQNMTIEEARLEIDKWYEEKVKSNYEAYQSAKSLKERYENILSKVQQWNPPTDEHVQLKKFCESQIQESVQWDCGKLEDYLKPISKPGPKEWLNDKIGFYQRDIEYHSKNQKEEIERINQRNKWIKDLRSSLVNIQ